MENPRLIIAKNERETLRGWIKDFNAPDLAVRNSVHALSNELDRAEVTDDASMPGDVIRLHSVVDIETSAGRRNGLQLVPPAEADIKQGKLSVLSVMGAALIGYREGARIAWTLPKGTEHITLVKVVNEVPTNA